MYFTKEKSNQKLTTTDIVVSIFATIFFLSVVYLGMVYA